MAETMCGWCGMPKDKHTVTGWSYCQSKINQSKSTKEMPGGVG